MPKREVNETSRKTRERLTAAVVLGLMFAARSSVADHYVVPSGSMEHALHPGDRIVADQRAYGWRVPFTSFELVDGADPAPGDVVVLRGPDGVRLVKRVVAVAGDAVSVRDGRVILDGVTLSRDSDPEHERYGNRVAWLDLRYGGGPDLPPLRVPAGHVLVLGDSRGNSRDSRSFGLVRERAIHARAVGVYYRSGEGLVWRPL